MSRFLRRVFGRRNSNPRTFPDSGFEVIDASEKIEEESLLNYRREEFYPVKIGQIFKSRYQVIGKLGYGTSATLWLCRDLKHHKYITLKVFRAGYADAADEVSAFLHLEWVKRSSTHPGSLLTRSTLKTFKITGGTYRHQCLIHEPLGITLTKLLKSCPFGRFPKAWLRVALQQILLALDFIHSEAHVIHTDLHPNNFLLVIADKSVLSDFENAEMNSPSPRKIDGNRVIYRSKELRSARTNGPPTLIDFGKARIGESVHFNNIQPFIYRAPEVLLEMPWDKKVDIWNLGVMAWNLFEGTILFPRPRDSNIEGSSKRQLARMVALLGPPPKDFLQRTTSIYFDENGEWKVDEEIPDISLESLEINLQGHEQVLFLQFIRKMLRWRPEERKSAKELLDDPWLQDTWRHKHSSTSGS